MLGGGGVGGADGEDGDIGADEFPPASVMGRRRSRAVLYQLSGHYKPEKVKTKLKINNVSPLSRVITIYISLSLSLCLLGPGLFNPCQYLLWGIEEEPGSLFHISCSRKWLSSSSVLYR